MFHAKRKLMRNLFYYFIVGVTMSLHTNAQINLIGASSNASSGNINLLKWQAMDSLSVTTIPTILDGYFYATSAFDPFKNNYYISGVAGQNTGLYSYNSYTGEESLMQGSLYSNVSEFDMSTGKMYNLIMETEQYISIYEYDIESNLESLIGVIYEPGATGIVADAIGFDSNNGILYYVGPTNGSELSLYAIPVRNNVFSFTKTLLNTSNSNNSVTSLNFDNVNEKLFAVNDTYDQSFNFTGRNIVEINKINGDVINLGQLVEFTNFAGGSSSFDQNSGTFLLVGIDNNNASKMIAFNTYSDTYVTGFVPENVSEIVCDNSIFAKNRYGALGIEQETTSNFKLYPNPVSEVLSIERKTDEPTDIQIFNSLGVLVFTQTSNASSKINLNLSSFPKGVYIVNLTTENQTKSEKIVVQ
jgi:hypothetical protein